MQYHSVVLKTVIKWHIFTKKSVVTFSQVSVSGLAPESHWGTAPALSPQTPFLPPTLNETIGYKIRFISERELTFTFAICYRPSVCLSSVCLSSVCLSVVCLSVTFVRPTQAAQIFGNISTALGTLAIHGHPLKI